MQSKQVPLLRSVVQGAESVWPVWAWPLLQVLRAGLVTVMSDLEEVLDEQLECIPSEDEGPSDDGESQDGSDPPVGKGGRGKGKQCKRKTGGSINLVNDFGKKRSRVNKDGKKYCAPCGRWLPISSFPPGSAQCGEDRKAIQGLAYCAKTQNQMQWWNDTCNDPAKLKKVVAAYKDRQPKAGKKRKEPFIILQYLEEIRQESAVLLDGVHEMMNESWLDPLWLLLLSVP